MIEAGAQEFLIHSHRAHDPVKRAASGIGATSIATDELGGNKIRQWNTLAWLDSGLVATNFDHHGTNILVASCNGGWSMMWLIICAVILAVSVGVCAAAVLMQPGESHSQTEM